jgi:hypothetical protein
MARAMRRHCIGALAAGALMTIPFLLFWVGSLVTPSLERFGDVLSWVTMFPGMVVLEFLGVRGGPEGMPAFPETPILSFVLWWVALDFGPPLWKWFWSKPADPAST